MERYAVGKIINRVREISRWHIECRLLRMMLRPEYTGRVTQQGNWVIPEDILSPSAICYCAGVGEDIDFELMLIERFGTYVYAFDPTPRAIEHVNKVASKIDKFRFLPVGIWSSDETLRFYAPENPTHVSHSVVDSNPNRPYFDAHCKKISTLMSELGHDNIDLLKMNIEGAEYEVLQSLVNDKLYPRVICLTFEGRSALVQAVQWCKKLRSRGYELAGLCQWAGTFVRKSTP